MNIPVENFGNPYASLQIHDDIDVGMPGYDVQDVTSDRVGVFGRNPYASLQMHNDIDVGMPGYDVRHVPPKPTGSVSKVKFQKTCYLIFRQYMPDLAKGIHRRYQDFITRNESRSPAARFSLLAELAKYDLADLFGANPLFNREPDVLTEEKLRLIEQSVADE